MGNPNPDMSGLMPPWKEGDPSPNPKGKAKGRTLKSIFDELLDMTAKGKVLDAEEVKQLAEELGRKVTYREAFAIRTMAKAISNPESKSAERMENRTEGKPKEQIEHTIIEDQSFKIGDQEIKF